MTAGREAHLRTAGVAKFYLDANEWEAIKFEGNQVRRQSSSKAIKFEDKFNGKFDGKVDDKCDGKYNRENNDKNASKENDKKLLLEII